MGDSVIFCPKINEVEVRHNPEYKAPTDANNI